MGDVSIQRQSRMERNTRATSTKSNSRMKSLTSASRSLAEKCWEGLDSPRAAAALLLEGLVDVITGIEAYRLGAEGLTLGKTGSWTAVASVRLGVAAFDFVAMAEVVDLGLAPFFVFGSVVW